MKSVGKLSGALAGVLALASVARAAPIVYDASSTFEAAGGIATDQPPFSLGTYNTALTPSSGFVSFPNYTPDIQGVQDRSDAAGANFAYNDSSNTPPADTAFSSTFNPYQLVAGPFGGDAVLRFTAPVAGNYSIDANFTDVQPANVNTPGIYEIFEDNTSLAQNSVTGVNPMTNGPAYASSLSYTSTTPLSLQAGDTIDFVVDSTNNTNDANTQVSATITSVVPEPASVGLVVVTGLGVLVRRRRRA